MNNQNIDPTNYYMPAEWTPQDAIWLSWPHNHETFGDLLTQVEEIYIQFIKALVSDQKIHLIILGQFN